MAMLMSHSDSQNGKNKFREWTFTCYTPSALRAVVAKQNWAKLRVFLRQPFQTPQTASTMGLSFIQVFAENDEETAGGHGAAEQMKLKIDPNVTKKGKNEFFVKSIMTKKPGRNSTQKQRTRKND